MPRCRSRQFSETFSFPPTNHFANGSFHSSTLLHFFCQISSAASRAQNLSGFFTDSSHSARYCARLWIRAFLLKSLAGLKTRFSVCRDSMFLLIAGLGGTGVIKNLFNGRSSRDVGRQFEIREKTEAAGTPRRAVAK